MNAKPSTAMPLVPLIRGVAIVVFLVGPLLLVRAWPGIWHYLMESLPEGEGITLVERWSRAIEYLLGPLRFCAIGGAAYLVTMIRFGRPRRRTPFNFAELIGNRLQLESPLQASNRMLLGVLGLLGGPLFSLIGNGLMRNIVQAGDPVIVLVAIPVRILIVLTGVWLFLNGLRALTPRAERALRRRKQSPILYLRSFQSDARLLDPELSGLVRLLFLGPLGHQTVEHSLALAVNEFRPLVAIGQPGERLPPLGAARLYVASEWQEVVGKLVAASPLVILRIGSTEGFWWEVEHLVKTCDPRKVLFYLPPRDRGVTYADWRDRAQQLFPHKLPPRPGNAMFLGFGPDWQPIWHGKRGASLGAIIRWPFGGRAPEVREALNSALRQLGANPTGLPLLRREWFFWTLLSLVTFVFVVPVIWMVWQQLSE